MVLSSSAPAPSRLPSVPEDETRAAARGCPAATHIGDALRLEADLPSRVVLVGGGRHVGGRKEGGGRCWAGWVCRPRISQRGRESRARERQRPAGENEVAPRDTSLSPQPSSRSTGLQDSSRQLNRPSRSSRTLAFLPAAPQRPPPNCLLTPLPSHRASPCPLEPTCPPLRLPPPPPSSPPEPVAPLSRTLVASPRPPLSPSSRTSSAARKATSTRACSSSRR